ncbi:MAG: hypothetical protein R2751_16355 [Bacteroidales bacterium]
MKTRNLVMLLFFLGMTVVSIGQEDGGKGKPVSLSGSAGITNNGISLIPNFSLGDPATLFNVSVSKGRLSFASDFNFSLEAKPWYILYWARYQLVDAEKFKLGTGTHLGLNFLSSTMQYERYWVIDLTPTYILSRKVSLGAYYLHSRGLDPGTVGASHFLTLQVNVTNIQIVKDFHLGFNPQIYFLKQDDPHGFYATSTLSLSKQDFPLTLVALINQPLRTEIVAGNEFVWNLSLLYTYSL